MSMTETKTTKPRIVVVGGGAGGLELATQLGRSLGRKGQADITLIDCTTTHIWKPLLHEVAAGTLDSHDDDVAYLAQASANHFSFVLGRMTGLDRVKKLVYLAPDLGNLPPEQALDPAYRMLVPAWLFSGRITTADGTELIYQAYVAAAVNP